MLSGQRAFAGGDVSEVLASVLAREPDWTLLPPNVSPVLGTYIRRCLHKDAKQRIHDIADVRLALEGAFETSVSQVAEAVAAALPMWRRPVPVAATAAVVAVLVTGVVGWSLWPETEPQPVIRSVHVVPDGRVFRNDAWPIVAISPNR